MSHDHVTSIPTYLFVFAALVVLTVLTVIASFQDLGVLNDIVALGIAGLKATLVILFFMHVKQATPLIKFVVVGGLLWLGIMIGLTVIDYFTRGFLPGA